MFVKVFCLRVSDGQGSLHYKAQEPTCTDLMNGELYKDLSWEHDGGIDLGMLFLPPACCSPNPQCKGI